MGLITVSGEPGCRFEEAGRLTAQRLRCEFVTGSSLAGMLIEEFGPQIAIPDKAYPHAVSSIVARIATQHHVVVCLLGAETLFRHYPGVLRVHVDAPEPRRTGNLMLDGGLTRPVARKQLRERQVKQRAERKRKFGRATTPPHLFDLVLNADGLEAEEMAEIMETAARVKGVFDHGLLGASAEAQLQFQVRLELAKHGITPIGHAELKRRAFGHPSEEVFANVLDFYRVAWKYEPKSFPIRWDKNGNVIEAFTPDFYLPEFNLYVELTTMKQSLVTRKNRKVKLLKTLYPDVNIQVFYQKDFQDLVFKYGLGERAAKQ